MTSTGMTQQLSRGLILAALLCSWTGTAYAGGSADRTPRAAAGQQILISAAVVTAGVSGAGTFAATLRLPHGIMLHRITIEVAGENGAIPDAAFDALLTAAAQHSGPRPLARLTSAQHVFELPRPLGLRLDRDEAVQVHGSVSGSAARQVTVILEYEPLDARLSRLAVLPVQIRLAGSADDEWHAPVDGRVMALSGVPMDMAGELILEDAETGEALWSEVLQPAGGEAFGRGGDVIRIGAHVEAGRRYRITLRPGSGTGAAAAAELLLHALLMPVRPTLVAAAH
jgi:hypothetical protein